MLGRRHPRAGRLGAILVLSTVLCGLPACTVISGVGNVEFVTCAITFGAPDSTLTAGGSGGEVFDDGCPEGQVLLGFQGGVISGGVAMSGLGGLCGVVSLSSPAPNTFTLEPGMALPIRGSMASNIHTATCPAGQVVVGFEGQTFVDTVSMGTFMATLAIQCAPVIVTGLPEAPTVSLGAITTLPPVGDTTDTMGSAIPAIGCPEGQIAVASRGQSTTVVDAFGLGCAAPTLHCTATTGE